MYIDAAVNEVAVDFIIVRPNKGILLLNIFEENLNECTLSEDKKEINVHGQLYQSPIDLINLCQLSIKDGIEELLMSTIEDNRNFSLIKKAVVFSENSIDEIKNSLNIRITSLILPLSSVRRLLKIEIYHKICILP